MSRAKLIKAAFNKEANMVQDRGNQKFWVGLDSPLNLMLLILLKRLKICQQNLEITIIIENILTIRVTNQIQLVKFYIMKWI